MQRMLVQLKSSLFMTVTVMDITTCIIPTWLLSRFAVLHVLSYRMSYFFSVSQSGHALLTQIRSMCS